MYGIGRDSAKDAETGKGEPARPARLALRVRVEASVHWVVTGIDWIGVMK